MDILETELAALRAEVAQLRRDLDRALELLNQPTSRDVGFTAPEYPSVVFGELCVRHDKKSIPLMMRSEPGETGLFLYDDQNRERARLAVDADNQVRFEIINAQGNVTVSLGEGDAGRGEVRVNEADGTPRAGLKVSDNGGVVTVVDSRGGGLATMHGTVAGGELLICTPVQQTMVTLKCMPEGGTMIVAEPGGQVMGHLSVTNQGAMLNINGEHGSPALMFSGLGELGGQIFVCNRDGDQIAALP